MGRPRRGGAKHLAPAASQGEALTRSHIAGNALPVRYCEGRIRRTRERRCPDRDDQGIEAGGRPHPTVLRRIGSSSLRPSSIRANLSAANAWSLEAIDAQLNRALRGNGSAKSAISAALHDIVGKRLGIPVYRMWGLDASDVPQSSFTIAIADNEGLRQRVADAAQYPILKVKLGTDRDLEIIRVIREAAPDKRLRVDANAAWTPAEAVNMTFSSRTTTSISWSAVPRTTSRASLRSALCRAAEIADELCLV